MHGKPLAYLDSADSSQKPRQVLDAMTTFYETSYANIHRGVYDLAERSTEAYEGARETVRAFVNAESDARDRLHAERRPRRSTSSPTAGASTTSAPATSSSRPSSSTTRTSCPGSTSPGRTGAEFAVVPVDADGELQLDELDELAARGRLKVLACTARLQLARHDQPARAARGVGPRAGRDRGRRRRARRRRTAGRRPGDRRRLRRLHRAQDLRPDRHRRSLGPRRSCWRRCRPSSSAAHMIRKVTVEKTTWNELPHKFEAGTPPIAQAVGLGAAIDYVDRGRPRRDRGATSAS